MRKILDLETEQFLKYFKGQEIFKDILQKLNAPPGEKLHARGLIGSFKTILLSNLFQNSSKNYIVLLSDREEAAYFYDDLNNLGLSETTLFFPSSYKRSILYDHVEQENIVQRTEVLNKIALNKENITINFRWTLGFESQYETS